MIPKKDIYLATTILIMMVTSFNFKKLENHILPTSWLNTKYINCLKSRLPCECETLTKSYFIIGIDTSILSKSFGMMSMKYNQDEFNYWEIKKKTYNSYLVYDNLGDSSHEVGKLLLKKDKIDLYDVEGNKSTFISIRMQNKNEPFEHLIEENMKLLNQAMKRKGYSLIEEVLGEDSLHCFCNKELGVNLISNYKKAWIIEKKQDSVFLLEYVNFHEDKMFPLRIDSKLIKAFRW